MIGIRRDRMAAGRPTAHWIAQAALAAAAAVALAACSGSVGASVAAAGRGHTSDTAARHAATDSVLLIGKIDADTGATGTFTGKDGWPAVAPSDIRVRAGATVVITIREYDDMVRGPGEEETPRAILQRRYAAGEIDEDEYLRRLAGLSQR